MIDILMAVYNGEKYIRQQIESILSQTDANWKLFIRDDCSTDSTVEILEEYVREYPERIVLFKSQKNSGSANKNFFELMKQAEHKYIMFCDHDDVWEPFKLEKTYRKMLETESSSGDIPILVHTDAKVSDENLNIISNSLFKFQQLNPKRNRLNNLLVQNIVTGCTMMANKNLVDKALVLSEHQIMHDWWLALVACCFGKIGFVSDKTMLYRQHEYNEVGAKNSRSIKYNINRFKDRSEIKGLLNDTFKQAEAFLDIYKDNLDEKQIRAIEAYINIPNLSKFMKIYTLFRYDFLKHGIKRKLGQIIFV